MAASITLKCLASQRKLCILDFWKVSATLPVFVCRLVTQLLHQHPILSSVGANELITPSDLLERSRRSWLIHLPLQLLPLPPLLLLLLLQPQLRLKPRKIWRTTNSASFICKTRK
uniref:Uncharacterized protein n=1 Tax=Saimiri boliviensis boliviensis TaxID=39432 RepID=A0A2K6SNJ9_SAIBB